MKAKTSKYLSTLLAAVGLLWCVGIGSYLWMTPIRSSGVSTQGWSSSDAAGTGSSGVVSVPVETSRSFAEVSRTGALPLVVPVLLAALATWAAWQNKKLALSLATAALLAFCLLAGFSIGPGYVVGAGAMLWALLVRVDDQPKSKPSAPGAD